MRQPMLKAIASFILVAAPFTPAYGANPARPGSINYIEGQVSIAGQVLDSKAIGTAELQPGQSLDTQIGKAEILLTPGTFLRLGDNSSVTMISPSLTDTELRLDKGRATVEVAELHQGNNLVITLHGDTVRLLKTGLYDFDADHNLVRVYQGEAVVRQMNRDVKVKGDHQVALGDSGSPKAEKFNKEQAQDDLYRWSSLRSSYTAEANVDRAQTYTMGGWYGAGWDWDPYYSCYTYIPGDGIFYSPFGWGFYSPFFVGYAPFGFFGHFHHDFDDFRHFEGRERGGRGHFGDRGHFGGGESHEAHYYDHFNHGSYHGPDHSSHSGMGHGGMGYGGGEHNGGGGFHGGESFHGGEGSHGGGGFHGGGGGGHGGGGGGHR